MTAAFAPAAELTTPALARLFERTFAEYVVPVRATPAALEARNRLESVDLYASRVALVDGEPVALALIARRGWRSRIAAMGVTVAHRGTGVAHALLARVIADARDRGDHTLGLECIASNERALRLYRRAGFVPTRRLVGWRPGALAPEPAPLVEVDPAEPGRVLARSDDDTLPWQLAPETLAVLTAPARGWTLGGRAYVVGTITSTELAVRAVITRPEHRRSGHAARLVRGLAAAFAPLPLSMIAIVPEGLGAELAGHLGLVPHEVAQVEMQLELRPPSP